MIYLDLVFLIVAIILFVFAATIPTNTPNPPILYRKLMATGSAFFVSGITIYIASGLHIAAIHLFK